MSLHSLNPDDSKRDWSSVRLTLVNSEIERRARRLAFLRAELLSEPAWDILLHAYSFELRRRHVTASELVDRISLPSTTLIRWIKVLELEGMLTRTIVASNPESLRIELTAKALDAMEGYFSISP